MFLSLSLSLSYLPLSSSSFHSFLPAKFLNDVTVPTISNEDCKKRASYDGNITDAMLCADYPEGGKDSYQGDSNGPLVKRTILQMVQNKIHTSVLFLGEKGVLYLTS